MILKYIIAVIFVLISTTFLFRSLKGLNFVGSIVGPSATGIATGGHANVHVEGSSMSIRAQGNAVGNFSIDNTTSIKFTISLALTIISLSYLTSLISLSLNLLKQ